MKFCYAFYELLSDTGLNAISSEKKRHGALLRITFENNKIGYADCHPWQELGDLSIDKILDCLSVGKLTPLSSRAIELARIDSEYRFARRPACEKQIPNSHYLVTDLLRLTDEEIKKIIKQEFSHIKLKLGRQLDDEIKCLLNFFSNGSLKLRFDFNETLTFSSFQQFLNSISQLHKHVDFIEDPCPYHYENWMKIQKEGWVLACDRKASFAANSPEAAKVLIIKPAILSEKEWRKWKTQTLIVTSYLGHPLEQVAAAYMASRIDPEGLNVHGLLSHRAYHPTTFSKGLNGKGPHFIPPLGYGFGFDEELQHLNWVAL